MEEMKIIGKKRTEKGKEIAKKMRAQGHIPAILYGPGKENVALLISDKEARKIKDLYQKENVLLKLTIEGEKKEKERTVLVKNVQRDVVKGSWQHIDFYQVAMDKTIRVHIPLKFIGEANGVKLGGILEPSLWEIEVECLPLNLPENIEINVEDMEIGVTLHVRDLTFPENVNVRISDDLAVVSVAAPHVEEEKPAEEVVEEVAGAPVEGEEKAPEAEKEPGEEEGKKSPGGAKS